MKIKIVFFSNGGESFSRSVEKRLVEEEVVDFLIKFIKIFKFGFVIGS